MTICKPIMPAMVPIIAIIPPREANAIIRGERNTPYVAHPVTSSPLKRYV